MTDHKFTDDDVIKALELCSKLDLSFEECDKCPYKGECGTKDGNMPADALALINRQKAEIERLETENKSLIENDVRNKYPNCVLVEKGRIYTRTLEDYDELIGDISAEAIKEFAERLKEGHDQCDGEEDVLWLIDKIVKEMTEGQK